MTHAFPLRKIHAFADLGAASHALHLTAGTADDFIERQARKKLRQSDRGAARRLKQAQRFC